MLESLKSLVENMATISVLKMRWKLSKPNAASSYPCLRGRPPLRFFRIAAIWEKYSKNAHKRDTTLDSARYECGSFRSLDEIGEFLRREVEICNQQHEGAKAAFRRTRAKVFDPEHDLKVEFAASLLANSRRSLLEALDRFNSFLSTGTIPEGLELQPQPSEQDSTDAA